MSGQFLCNAPFHDEMGPEAQERTLMQLARELHRDLPMATIQQLMAEGMKRNKGSMNPANLERAILETYGE